MPFTTAALNTGAAAIAAAGRFVSAHSSDPGTTGAGEIAGVTRVQTTFATAANGSTVGSQVSLAIPAGTTVTHWGLWSAATGGTFQFGGVLAAAETFGGAGTLQHTPTVTVTN